MHAAISHHHGEAQYERCAVRVHATAGLLRDRYRFAAVAEGPRGHYQAAVSGPFLVSVWRNGPLTRDRHARTELTRLVDHLTADGWEPLPALRSVGILFPRFRRPLR